MSPISNNELKQKQTRTLFRQLSREVLLTVHYSEPHLKRIRVAAEMNASEPLQGALADYFYGCWHHICFDDRRAENILFTVKSRLNAQIFAGFESCLSKQDYVEKISQLATCWSVLVTPSMDMPLHRLRTSKQNSFYVVDELIALLIEANEDQDTNEVNRLESAFFDHCLVCHDLMAFMKVSFKLNKQNWHFDERWQECQEQLEKLVG